MNTELDILCRLQVLEGALKIPRKTWYDQGKSGLKKAEAACKAAGYTDIDPNWFAATDQHLYKACCSKASRILEGNANEDAEDVMQRILSGVSKDSEGTVILVLYSRGRYAAQEIFDGMPITGFFTGFLASCVRNRAQDVTKPKIQTRTVSFDIRKHDLAAEHSTLFSKLDLKDPTVQARLMAALAHDSLREHKYLKYWLDVFFLTGELLSKTDLARLFSSTNANVGDRMNEGFAVLQREILTWPEVAECDLKVTRSLGAKAHRLISPPISVDTTVEVPVQAPYTGNYARLLSAANQLPGLQCPPGHGWGVSALPQ